MRPTSSDGPLTWGRKDGIVFGLPSPGGIKGPRGLIRIGVVPPNASTPQLLNYIAIEPVVAGPGSRSSRMAFSELEPSVLDPGQRGKRLWLTSLDGDAADAYRGKLETVQAGKTTVERLSVRIQVERFTANGADVSVVASIDSDHPSELHLAVFAAEDSPPLDELTVTATMGNFERLRRLWLRHEIVDSRDLFRSYTENNFVELNGYPVDEMIRNYDGDAVVYATSSEPDPASTPGNAEAHWPYLLPKYTQYWRVSAHDIQPDLRVRVNARRVYWNSTAPVLGGIAFENFEVRERYVPGQQFIFGISRQEPPQIDTSLAPLEKSAGEASTK